MYSKILLATLILGSSSALITSCSAEGPQYSSRIAKGTGDAATKENGGKTTTPVQDDQEDDDKDPTPTSGNSIPDDDETTSVPNPTPTPTPTPTPSPTPTPTPTPSTAAEEIKKKCTPTVEYVNDNSAGGKKFAQYVPDAKLAMIQAAQYVCSVLYKSAAEVPPVTKVKLFLENMDGVAYATGGNGGKELHISTNYINGLNGDIKLEIDGVLIHENTHIWQWSSNGVDGGFIEGIADYVRAGGSWYPSGSRNGKGGKYNDAYTTSAYFIGWLNSKYPDFAYKFNLAQKAWPGVGFFKTVTGTDVNALWSQYQSEGTFSPKSPDWVAKAVPIKLGQ